MKKIGLYKADINFHSEVKAVISIKIDKIQNNFSTERIKTCVTFLFKKKITLKYDLLVEEVQSLQNNQDNKQPSNLEAEQALIGSVLVNNDIIDEVSSFIKPSIFYDPLILRFMK